MNFRYYLLVTALLYSSIEVYTQQPTRPARENADSVLALIRRVNQHWQHTHSPRVHAFWDQAAYQSANMDAFSVTGDSSFVHYAEAWATYNQWMGAKSGDTSEWKYTYGETDEYVLFGDWQICFQTYIDLYKLTPEPIKIARAKQVMHHQVNTRFNGYWWWADGLYMAMPVMTRMYELTGNRVYLRKLFDYFQFADSLMFDPVAHLYYRDAKYLYPAHRTNAGKKDFWSRGNGWVIAALAKVLERLPQNDPHRPLYLQRFREMAAALKNCQQSEGYWTRSLIDPMQAPGYESSGTSFFTYAILWGIHHGILTVKEYLPVVNKSWHSLLATALQNDGNIGYVQPIGEKAIPGQVVNQQSVTPFGTGAFLLAACEMYRWLKKK